MVKRLQQGRPRTPSLTGRGSITQPRAHHGLAVLQSVIQSIARVQAQPDPALFPGRLDRTALTELLDERPQTLGRKAPPGQAAGRAQVEGSSTPLTPGTPLAAYAPASNPIALGCDKSPVEAMPNQNAAGATCRAAQGAQMIQHQLDVSPVPKEIPHPRSIRMLTRGSIQDEGDHNHQTALRRRRQPPILPDSRCSPSNHTCVPENTALRCNCGK